MRKALLWSECAKKQRPSTSAWPAHHDGFPTQSCQLLSKVTDSAFSVQGVSNHRQSGTLFSEYQNAIDCLAFPRSMCKRLSAITRHRAPIRSVPVLYGRGCESG